jgi:REP element-mobilizing transposase RayT
MARGIERRKIFKDDKDRTSFLERLAVILEETQTQCYAWTLIPNHFHLLLRTGLSASADASRCRAGPTPLSTVMRRLMTGYAVTFNKRHRRSGHLFQNRYKSVICEEDPYLLELIRYIHLNPLRAKLVEDLKALDKYPWTCHSAILGRRKNPLIPKGFPSAEGGLSFSLSSGKGKHQQNPEKLAGAKLHAKPCPVKLAGAKLHAKPCPVKNKSLAERTIEDVLLHFGDNLGEARSRYRQFVKNGIEFSISLQDLVSKVCSRFEITFDELTSGRRKRNLSQARAVLCYLAVDKLGYSGENMARTLGISGRGVSDCRDRGKKILDNPETISEYLT